MTVTIWAHITCAGVIGTVIGRLLTEGQLLTALIVLGVYVATRLLGSVEVSEHAEMVVDVTVSRVRGKVVALMSKVDQLEKELEAHRTSKSQS